MKRRALILAGTAACLPACHKKEENEIEETRFLTVAGWPSKPYDRVVGYQFLNPRGPHGWGSPILDDKFSQEELTKLKRKEAKLHTEQVGRLLAATFNSNPKGAPAPCYYPHHIFVFYSGHETVSAIEVCFACNAKRAWPDPPQGLDAVYPELAKLAEELELGTNAPKEEQNLEMPDPFGPGPKKK